MHDRGDSSSRKVQRRMKEKPQSRKSIIQVEDKNSKVSAERKEEKPFSKPLPRTTTPETPQWLCAKPCSIPTNAGPANCVPRLLSTGKKDRRVEEITTIGSKPQGRLVQMSQCLNVTSGIVAHFVHGDVLGTATEGTAAGGSSGRK